MQLSFFTEVVAGASGSSGDGGNGFWTGPEGRDARAWSWTKWIGWWLESREKLRGIPSFLP